MTAALQSAYTYAQGDIQMKTTQQKFDDTNAKLAQLSQETGFLQYNITTYQDQLGSKNVEIRNLIVDMNKLSAELEKEKAMPVNLAPAPTEATVDAVQ